MTDLPQYIRRSPFVLYGLGVAMGAWRFQNEWSQTTAAFQYGDLGAQRNMYLSSALNNSLYETVYLVASGLMIHILIAIYDKVGRK